MRDVIRAEQGGRVCDRVVRESSRFEWTVI
jgi:hypothetical protein